MSYRKINLSLFGEENVMTTGTAGLSGEMKTYYSDYLADNAKANLIHDQFAQKVTIPENCGKTIEFRSYSNLSKALSPLTEGVTPTGSGLTVGTVTSTVNQYGDFITLSDIFKTTAVDNNLVQAVKLLGIQSGETLDTVTREVINGGTNVQYGDGFQSYSARSQLTASDKLSVKGVQRAARTLKNNKAPRIDGSYVAIIHPDVAFDLMRDSEWVNANNYSDTQALFEGEIGKLAGVRFIESSEAKIFRQNALYTDGTSNVYSITAGASSALSGNVLTIMATLTSAQQAEIKDKYVILPTSNVAVKITAATASTVTLDLPSGATVADGAVLKAAGAASDGKCVYSTLFLGANAYGVTDVSGLGLEMILKPLGSGQDPLNQRATVGWKAVKSAEILVPQFMLRVETVSSFSEAE